LLCRFQLEYRKHLSLSALVDKLGKHWSCDAGDPSSRLRQEAFERTAIRQEREDSRVAKATDSTGLLVGAVGIEFIKAQNPKELGGMCRSRKSFVVLGWNYCCPRIAPAFL
jgi:hypothetical protein